MAKAVQRTLPAESLHSASAQVDVVNDFEFPDGDKILINALPVAPRLARLKKKAREANIPVIYVNDNKLDTTIYVSTKTSTRKSTTPTKTAITATERTTATKISTKNKS